MKGRAFLLLIIALSLTLLFTADHSEAAQIQGDPSSVPPPTDKKTRPVEGANITPPDPVKAGSEKTGEDPDGASQGETKRDGKNDVSKERPGGREDKKPEPKAEKGKTEGGSDGGLDPKPGRVEESGVEQCDPSNRCIDKKNKFVACLRVPGKDSLDPSLLIQNKGTGSIDVNIVVPSFVSLDQATVQLQSKETKEVKVSVADGANDIVIVLRAGEGNCTLNFLNMISDSIRKSETSALSGYARLSTRASFICISLAAVVIISGAWLCIRFLRMHHQEGSPNYQKVEMGLPISSGGKKEVDNVDGWDNSWGDGWDDEEAPMTPSKPASNPSSKGLASRRSNKDGWKD